MLVMFTSIPRYAALPMSISNRCISPERNLLQLSAYNTFFDTLCTRFGDSVKKPESSTREERAQHATIRPGSDHGQQSVNP
jgi:hypothetical protein